MARIGDLTDEEWAALQAHMKKYPKAEICPVCDSTDWAIPSEKEHGLYAEEGYIRYNGVLVITSICKTCFFIRRFALNGILHPDAARVEKGDG